MSESTYHQIHFAWAEPTLLGRVGPGPAASSLTESGRPSLRSWRDRLVPALTVDYRSALPGTDPADLPETLWARSYADGQAALVYRWPGDVRDAHAWAVVGPAHGLTLPRILSLHENPNTRPAARRPPAPGWASMPTLGTPTPWELTAAPGAVRTRDRRAAETTVQDEAVLVGAVASALHAPDRPIRIALEPEHADLWQATQVRVLWGMHRILHDVLTPARAIPAAGWQWSFSTYDPDLGTEGQHLAFGPPRAGADGPYLHTPDPEYRRVAERLVGVLRDEGGDALADHLRGLGVPDAPTFGDRRALIAEWLDPDGAAAVSGGGAEEAVAGADAGRAAADGEASAEERGLETGGPGPRLHAATVDAGERVEPVDPGAGGYDGEVSPAHGSPSAVGVFEGRWSGADEAEGTDIPEAEPLPSDAAAPGVRGMSEEEGAVSPTAGPGDAPPLSAHRPGGAHLGDGPHRAADGGAGSGPAGPARPRPHAYSRSVAGAHPSFRLNRPSGEDDGDPLPEVEDLDAPASAGEARASAEPDHEAHPQAATEGGAEEPGESAADPRSADRAPRHLPGAPRPLFGERRPGFAPPSENRVFGAPEPHDPPSRPTGEPPPLDLPRTPENDPHPRALDDRTPENDPADPAESFEPPAPEPRRSDADRTRVRGGPRRHAEEAFGGPAREEPDDPDGLEDTDEDAAPQERPPAQAPPLMVAPDGAPSPDYAAETEPEADPDFDDSGANWPTQYADLPLSRLERWHAKRGPEGAHTDVVDARAAVRAERSELQHVRDERDHYHAEVQDLRREIARLDRPFLDGDDAPNSASGGRRWAARLLVAVLLVAFLATGLEAGARFGVGALDVLSALPFVP
ncbi:hypothetical protein [Nocardiopsis salina]|uniref:hypothetical protein n=1 Tax=Nocardiopsis salina TaxID=245836 RepID=UPI00034AC6A1|nr:hypothetical protein [Nocardiopsis salina]